MLEDAEGEMKQRRRDEMSCFVIFDRYDAMPYASSFTVNV